MEKEDIHTHTHTWGEKAISKWLPQPGLDQEKPEAWNFAWVSPLMAGVQGLGPPSDFPGC